MKRTTQHSSRTGSTRTAPRGAGLVFLCAAAGLAAGMLWRSLVQPTEYRSEAAAAVTETPAVSGSGVWESRLASWRGLTKDRSERMLLGNSLRFMLKLSLTETMPLDTETFTESIASFDPPRTVSASLVRGRAGRLLGPSLTVSLRDLAHSLDFQTLAAVIADLDPVPGTDGWDFSAFFDADPSSLHSRLVTIPDPSDRFFAVFFRLDALLHPERPAAGPEDAWRTAADTVAARLEREAQFAGGGGFGPAARRELLREIAALPALAANGLWQVHEWGYGGPASAELLRAADLWENGVSLTFAPGASGGRLTAETVMELYPLAAPRDTAAARIPPLVTAVLLQHIAAREEALSLRAEAAAPADLPESHPPAAAADLNPAGAGAASPERLRTAETAAARRQLREAELALLQAGRTRDTLRRRLETDRAEETRLTLEAIAARGRADRLQERYDAAVRAQACSVQPPPESAALLTERGVLLERLTELLQTCTEEHPFVRQVRRELAALDLRLAPYGSGTPQPAAEAEAVRLANLLIEAETAAGTAAAAEERQRRQTAAAACTLAETEAAEQAAAEREKVFLQIREAAAVQQNRPAAAPDRLLPSSAAEPVLVTAPPETHAVRPTLHFSLPAQVPLSAVPPSWRVPLLGMLAGMFAGALAVLLRTLLGVRFRNGAEAAARMPHRILAALPAYDASSFRTAAGAMEGDLITSRSRRQTFIPAQTGAAEPPPAGRRPAVHAAAAAQGSWPWAAGAACLLAAALAAWVLLPALTRPDTRYPSGLALPQSVLYTGGDAAEAERQP